MLTDQNRQNIELQNLIHECVKGNRNSQNNLYVLFAPKMFIVCQRFCKNREEAEEVLQEGFLKVFEFLHQFKFAGSFEGWMRKIMVNCALQKFRSKPRMHIVMSTDEKPLEALGTEETLSQIGTKELLKMIQQLPPVYRMVFNLYVFEGMKHKEIGKALGITEGTSKSNLYDARAILQKMIANSHLVAKEKTNCL